MYTSETFNTTAPLNFSWLEEVSQNHHEMVRSLLMTRTHCCHSDSVLNLKFWKTLSKYSLQTVDSSNYLLISQFVLCVLLSRWKLCLSVQLPSVWTLILLLQLGKCLTDLHTWKKKKEQNLYHAATFFATVHFSPYALGGFSLISEVLNIIELHHMPWIYALSNTWSSFQKKKKPKQQNPNRCLGKTSFLFSFSFFEDEKSCSESLPTAWTRRNKVFDPCQ